MHVLAVNCGSSSLKYAVFEADAGGERSVARGMVDRIGEAVPDHAAAVRTVLERLSGAGTPAPDVIGHRVVHGGAERSAPALIDKALLDSLHKLVPFAPLHLPAEKYAIWKDLVVDFSPKDIL